MKRYFLLKVFVIVCIPYMQAQLSFGPTLGIGQNYLELVNASPQISLTKASKISPIAGIKTELPIHKFMFVSINTQFGKSKNISYEYFAQMFENIFIINQFRTNINIHGVFFNHFSIGIGVDYLNGKYKSQLYKEPNLKSFGTLLSGSYRLKNWVAELSCLKAIVTKDKRKEQGILHLKPLNAVQFSVSYLFKTNLSLTKKGIDCPRF